MIRTLPTVRQHQEAVSSLSSCQHRTVSKDGRIVCAKIVEGDNSVSPDVCHTCPFRTVNCAHLRFSLQQTSPSPLVVRFNGRTEVWDDDPPEIRFDRAACEVKVMPIEHPRMCAACVFRQPLHTAAEQPRRRQREVVGGGKVVPFPARGAAAAAG